MFWGVGFISNPFSQLAPGLYPGTSGQGLFIILNSLVKLVIVTAGLYAFWNFISAGYLFMSAGGDPKNIAKAWAKIWQSLIGLLVVAGSFVLAIIFGALIFGRANALLLIQPVLYTP